MRNAINGQVSLYVYANNFLYHFSISEASRVFLALHLSELPTRVNVLLFQTISATCARENDALYRIAGLKGFEANLSF